MAETVSSQDIQDDQESNGGMSPGANSDSTGANNAPRPGSIKDRACPFCHQYFTSSSLGRHLDTFIRSKNPKAPDGIHDLAEIRKLRGGITRRHARVSSHPTSNSKQSPSEVQRPVHAVNGYAPGVVSSPNRLNGQDGPSSVFRSKADWMVTGVINNLPPRNSITSISRDPLRRRAEYPEDSDPQQLEEKEIAYATEMALKEVLASIQEAASRVQKSSLFEFDVLALNFPALCLKLLSPPTTLFSTTPATTYNAWPLEVPSEDSYQQVYRILRERINQQVKRAQGTFDVSPSQSKSTISEREALEQSLPETYKVYIDHLHRTYEQWSELPDNRKQEIWTLELMRALAEEMRKTQAMDLQLEDAHREVKYLRGEVDSFHHHHSSWYRSGTPQTGPVTAVHPSSSALLSKNMAHELAEAGIDLREWDFDRLVSKWRTNLRDRPDATKRAGSRRTSAPAGSKLSSDPTPAKTWNLQDLADISSQMEPADLSTGRANTRRPQAVDIEADNDDEEDDDDDDDDDVEMEDEESMQGPKTRRMLARHGNG